MKSNSIDIINELAMNEINTDLDKAFLLFGLNTKENPSLKTVHNFGVFLSKYGHECSFVQKPHKLALGFLKDSLTINPNFLSHCELGDLFFHLKKYNLAIKEYTSALKYNETFEIWYNLSVCYFLKKNYIKTISILRKIVDGFKFPNEGLFDIYILLTFSYILNNDKNEAKSIFHLITNNNSWTSTPDTLLLAYFCEDYQYILDNYETVLKEWFFDAKTFQVIYQTYSKYNANKLNDFIVFFTEEIDRFFENNADFDKNMKNSLLNIVHNGPYIPTLEYTPQWLWQINFMI